jgi:hypothetical protein
MGNSGACVSLLHHFHNYLTLLQLCDICIDVSLPFIASEFYRLNRPDLDNISFSVLFHILSHDALVISSEDSLFYYLISRMSSNPESFNLLQFVRFEYLSSESISVFVSRIPNFIDRHLWSVISPRLLESFPPQIQSPLQEAKSLDDLISYLTQKHGGNVHDRGIVTITSKSVASYSRVQNVADLTSNSYFHSINEPGQ